MSVEILDLTNYRDRNGSRVPEGNYLVQVAEVEVGKSAQKGTHQWTIYLQIVGGEHDGSTIIDRQYPQSEGALFRVVGMLNGLGIKTSQKRMTIDTSKLVGKKARVDVADGDPYNGTIRSEVKSWQRFVSAKPSATDELDELEDQVDEDEETEEEAPAPAPVKRKKKAKPAPAPVEEEDDEDEDSESDTDDDTEIDLDDVEV